MTDATRLAYTVDGMTCSSCRLSVTEEVGELEGVEQVAVDLESGSVEVVGTHLDDAAIRSTLAEIGYPAR